MNTSDFGSYEFIWMNTNTNITAQGMYIGAELIDDIAVTQINENDKQFNRYKQYVKELKKYIC